MNDTANSQRPKDDPESVLISQRIIPYLHSLGYQYLDSDLRVSIGNSDTEVDLVAYLDQEKSKPYIVVEVKQRLPSEVTLLDPAVQQVFSKAAILSMLVRYLLVTDGSRYNWFERSAEGRSLVQLNEAPEVIQETSQLLLFPEVLVPITDPERFAVLMQSVMKALVREGVVFGLRMGIEMNRILIAKLRDEQVLQSGGISIFSSKDKSEGQVAQNIRRLYKDALADLGGVFTIDEGLWTLSENALLTVVKILEPYALSTVTPSVRGRFFWQAFADFSRTEGGMHTTPVALAELLVLVVGPRPGDRVIDPACGTGLFLIETLKYMETQRITEQASPTKFIEKTPTSWRDVIGVERNAEVAELAVTNLVLNGMSPKQIVRTNTLDEQALENSSIHAKSYDIVLMDPPIGVAPRDKQILQQYDIVRSVSRITLEMLFIERAVKLLRPGGFLGILVPDSLLSSPTYSRVRTWILNRTRPKAIISLPPDAFAPVGHSGKASILLLQNDPPDLQSSDSVLVADIQSIGYDKFGHPTAQSDLPALMEAVRVFRESGQIDLNKQDSKLNAWLVPTNELSDKRLDVAHLNPASRDLLRTVKRNQYPTVPLNKLVKILSGNDFNNNRYIEKNHDAAMVLQAGSVRDLKLDFSDVPYISFEDYKHMQRAQVKIGDVLVTTKGQYLGRAAAIDELPNHAVASGAVTILRPLPEVDIDPFFLATVISSDLGKKQIAQKQAATIAQPFIRRSDLGTILIPLPDIRKQQEIAIRLREMVTSVQKLLGLVQQMEAATKELVISELYAGDDNE